MTQDEHHKSFSRFIQLVGDGECLRRLDQELFRLTTTLKRERSVQAKSVKGKLTLTIQIVAEDEKTIHCLGDVKVTEPKKTNAASFMFLDVERRVGGTWEIRVRGPAVPRPRTAVLRPRGGGPRTAYPRARGWRVHGLGALHRLGCPARGPSALPQRGEGRSMGQAARSGRSARPRDHVVLGAAHRLPWASSPTGPQRLARGEGCERRRDPDGAQTARVLRLAFRVSGDGPWRLARRPLPGDRHCRQVLGCSL